MNPQPDFERLADVFVGAGEELRKLPNVPVINQGQNILTAITTMQARMDTQFDALGARVGRLEARFDRLEARFDGLEARFDGLEARFDGLQGQFNGLQLQQSAESQNQLARLFNSHVTSPTHDFEPLRNAQNQVPRGFPRNGTALASMTSANLARLLTSYGLQPQEEVEGKRRQLRHFIGVVYQV
ncbi:hypothetical protein ABVK25_000576 [Lepraria finkii]|uniref:Uncharacterized protein n=1 Tax=Lepraria finkii TaxID=1340010 RepID=A0ABR4BQT7_9LECA